MSAWQTVGWGNTGSQNSISRICGSCPWTPTCGPSIHPTDRSPAGEGGELLLRSICGPMAASAVRLGNTTWSWSWATGRWVGS